MSILAIFHWFFELFRSCGFCLAPLNLHFLRMSLAFCSLFAKMAKTLGTVAKRGVLDPGGPLANPLGKPPVRADAMLTTVRTPKARSPSPGLQWGRRARLQSLISFLPIAYLLTSVLLSNSGLSVAQLQPRRSLPLSSRCATATEEFSAVE